MRGSNWKALNGNVLMVWIGGRLWEVVANGGLTVLKTQLLMKYVTYVARIYVVSTAIWLGVSFTICKINGGSFLYKKLG